MYSSVSMVINALVKKYIAAWLSGFVGWSFIPYTKRSQVQFPVRAQT